MKKLSEIPVGQRGTYKPLSRRVLVVIARRAEGWCMYIDAVAGHCHDVEFFEIYKTGTKVDEAIAKAIIKTYFPNLEIDLPYIG